MNQRLARALSYIKYEAEPDLALNIWYAILLRNKRVANFKLFVFSLVGFASLLGLVPAIKMLINNFAQSGFYEYFSLAFSDSGPIIAYWKDFLFLLAESLPVMSVILFLMLIFIFFLSLKYTMKQITKSRLISFSTLSA